MAVLLIQVYILWTKLTPAHVQNCPSITLFLPALGFLGCSAAFGGIVLPAYLGRPFAADMKDYTIFTAVAASLLFIASCVSLFSVIIIRKKTLSNGQSEALRKVLIVLSLWIITGIIGVVFAALIRTFSLPFDPSILLFGISSLATILILPDTFVRAESSKLGS
ncbi:hypothetical protein DL96DRAFT_1614727 [Flagelloscypha sp. PMI_526]|nr:hypothetical protein DL96DRAFT_1614727 [Flagelloscypha sp. PMI_526]